MLIGVKGQAVCSISIRLMLNQQHVSLSLLVSVSVLTDTVDTSPHPSEEMMSIQSEHRSSKCPQDRELPSIPCANSLTVAVASGDGTYEVLREGASHDVIEDSPYETVKELKEASLTNGTLTPNVPPTAPPNGHLSPSPGTPDLCPLNDVAEYASIDLKKKSRYSVEAEAQRSALEQPEEENPPPIPDKVLDENDNHNIATLQNGEVRRTSVLLVQHIYNQVLVI